MENNSLKRSALAISIISAFTTPFMGSAVNIALPSIEHDFQIDAVLLSWIATSYILATVVSLVPFGRFADIYGRKKIFLHGFVIFSASSLLCGLSSGPILLILFRILQGVGSAMFFATGMAILISIYPPQERGKVLGINVAAVYVGLSIGPLAGGVLTEYLTWRSVFLVNVPIGLIIVFLVLWKLKGEWLEAKGEKFDLTGSILYTIAIMAIVYGITRLSSPKSLWVMIIGFICLFVFIKWEFKIQSPVFDLNLFKSNRVFTFSSLAALINYSATFAITFLLSIYLQHIKALSPKDAGIIMVAQPIVMALLSPMAGRLSDRIEPRIVASMGMALTSAGLFLFIFLDQDSSLISIVIRLLIVGIGFAFFSSPNTNAIMSAVEKRFYGLASGAVGTMRQLGMMFSMAITTLIFGLFLGRAQITAETYPILIQSLTAAFVVFSILCVVGVFSSLVSGQLREEPRASARGSSKEKAFMD